MEKRRLGNSDLYISVIGLGCWQYGGGDYWGEQSQTDVNRIVHRALDDGVNYFDTAEVYNNGRSEVALGDALKGRRTEAIIGTKVAPNNVYPEDLRKSCEESLMRLQTDYIDLYMIHWPINPLSVKHFTNDQSKINNPPNIQDALYTLEQLKSEGKIRHIGISNHGLKQMTELQQFKANIVTNELPYNLLSRAIEGELTLYCSKNNIGIIGYMPLQQGLLSGKYSIDEMKPMQARSRHFHYSRGEQTRHSEEGAEVEIEEALKAIQALSNEYGVDLITLSLSWVLANRHITTTIVGSRNEEQLRKNLQGASYKIPPELLTKLNGISKPILDKLGGSPDYYENRTNSRIY